MTSVILLTAAQAGAVRGSSASVEGAALKPVELTDGRFVLPIAVIADPAHVAHAAFLSTLPRQDLAQLLDLMPPPPEE